MTGRLSGGHQAAVMCMEVGKLSNEEDLVITGSKDHYIKVCEWSIIAVNDSFKTVMPSFER